MFITLHRCLKNIRLYIINEISNNRSNVLQKAYFNFDLIKILLITQKRKKV